MRGFLSGAFAWAKGRSWLLRAILLAFLFYIFIRHIGDTEYQSIFKGLNLGIHELGHFVFGILGEFIGVAGGTLAQLLAPIIGIVMFFLQEDYFAIAVAFGWLATNLFDVAAYASDARAMALPLVSPFGGECYHDWNYLLDKLGLLSADKTIGFLFRVLGFFSFTICFAFGGSLLYVMIRSYRKKQIHKENNL